MSDDDVRSVRIEIYPLFECDDEKFKELLSDLADVMVKHHGAIDDDEMKSLMFVRQITDEDFMTDEWIHDNMSESSGVFTIVMPGGNTEFVDG